MVSNLFLNTGCFPRSNSQEFRVTGLLSSLGSVSQHIKVTETAFSNLFCSVFHLQFHISNAYMPQLLLAFHRIVKVGKALKDHWVQLLTQHCKQTHGQICTSCCSCSSAACGQEWPRSWEYWQRWWQEVPVCRMAHQHLGQFSRQTHSARANYYEMLALIWICSRFIIVGLQSGWGATTSEEHPHIF